jgi:hypothetical protein
MSFEKRKQDGFLTKKLAEELKLYHTTPEELNPVRKMAIDYMLSDSWKNYKHIRESHNELHTRSC